MEKNNTFWNDEEIHMDIDELNRELMDELELEEVHTEKVPQAEEVPHAEKAPHVEKTPHVESVPEKKDKAVKEKKGKKAGVLPKKKKVRLTVFLSILCVLVLAAMIKMMFIFFAGL